MIKQTERAVPAASAKRWAAGTLLAILLLCAVSAAYVSGARTAEVLARKRELPV